MLTEICAEIRNYFLRDRYKDIHAGKFTISDGHIERISFLQENQYYRIVGSVFNDGVHKYSAGEVLTDETFSGAIWAMAVPPSVIALDAEIQKWIDDNAQALSSPYQSESFGGYSYSKASGSNGANGSGGGAYSWKDQFAGKLNQYRRVSVL